MGKQTSYQSFPQGDFVARPEIDSKFSALEEKFNQLNDRFNEEKHESHDWIKEIRREFKRDIDNLSNRIDEKTRIQEDRTGTQIDRIDHLIQDNRKTMDLMIAESSKSSRWTATIIISVAGLVILALKVISSSVIN